SILSLNTERSGNYPAVPVFSCIEQLTQLVLRRGRRHRTGKRLPVREDAPSPPPAPRRLETDGASALSNASLSSALVTTGNRTEMPHWAVTTHAVGREPPSPHGEAQHLLEERNPEDSSQLHGNTNSPRTFDPSHYLDLPQDKTIDSEQLQDSPCPEYAEKGHFRWWVLALVTDWKKQKFQKIPGRQSLNQSPQVQPTVQVSVRRNDSRHSERVEEKTAVGPVAEETAPGQARRTEELRGVPEGHRKTCGHLCPQTLASADKPHQVVFLWKATVPATRRKRLSHTSHGHLHSCGLRLWHHWARACPCPRERGLLPGVGPFCPGNQCASLLALVSGDQTQYALGLDARRPVDLPVSAGLLHAVYGRRKQREREDASVGEAVKEGPALWEGATVKAGGNGCADRSTASNLVQMPGHRDVGRDWSREPSRCQGFGLSEGEHQWKETLMNAKNVRELSTGNQPLLYTIDVTVDIKPYECADPVLQSFSSVNFRYSRLTSAVPLGLVVSEGLFGGDCEGAALGRAETGREGAGRWSWVRGVVSSSVGGNVEPAGQMGIRIVRVRGVGVLGADTGRCVAKPDVIIRLEEGAEPWAVGAPPNQSLTGQSVHTGGGSGERALPHLLHSYSQEMAVVDVQTVGSLPENNPENQSRQLWRVSLTSSKTSNLERTDLGATINLSSDHVSELILNNDGSCSGVVPEEIGACEMSLPQEPAEVHTEGKAEGRETLLCDRFIAPPVLRDEFAVSSAHCRSSDGMEPVLLPFIHSPLMDVQRRGAGLPQDVRGVHQSRSRPKDAFKLVLKSLSLTGMPEPENQGSQHPSVTLRRRDPPLFRHIRCGLYSAWATAPPGLSLKVRGGRWEGVAPGRSETAGKKRQGTRRETVSLLSVQIPGRWLVTWTPVLLCGGNGSPAPVPSQLSLVSELRPILHTVQVSLAESALGFSDLATPCRWDFLPTLSGRCCNSKPEVIIRLEGGAEPWTVERPPHQRLSGQSASAGRGDRKRGPRSQRLRPLGRGSWEQQERRSDPEAGTEFRVGRLSLGAADVHTLDDPTETNQENQGRHLWEVVTNSKTSSKGNIDLGQAFNLSSVHIQDLIINNGQYSGMMPEDFNVHENMFLPGDLEENPKSRNTPGKPHRRPEHPGLHEVIRPFQQPFEGSGQGKALDKEELLFTHGRALMGETACKYDESGRTCEDSALVAQDIIHLGETQCRCNTWEKTFFEKPTQLNLCRIFEVVTSAFQYVALAVAEWPQLPRVPEPWPPSRYREARSIFLRQPSCSQI
ncbi:Zinc finger protein 717, partial [Galemys pyrenaicus]